jgi:hypothetical protein
MSSPLPDGSAGGPYALACAAAMSERVRQVATLAGAAPLEGFRDVAQLGLWAGAVLTRSQPTTAHRRCTASASWCAHSRARNPAGRPPAARRSAPVSMALTERYRVVEWTTGNIGTKSVAPNRRELAVELVGCYAWSADKVGCGVGELCGIQPLGVLATDDIDALIALRPQENRPRRASGAGLDPLAPPGLLGHARACLTDHHYPVGDEIC